MTDRIRWTDNGMGGFDGHVGTSKRLTFELWQAPADAGFPTGDWVITSEFPLPDASGPGYTYAFSGKDPGELRARAERRLEEFISSLGAIFPDAVAADLRFRADEMESYVGGGDEGRHDRSMFATGMRRSADLIEHGDIPGTTAREKE